jgi:mannose-1-phosphate guanylyltransferase
MDNDALVAILPGDHYYADEARFTAALESAFEIAAAHSESVVLIGAHPDRPEIEYGWIAPGESVENQGGELFRVAGFLEKPSLDVARQLIAGFWAWNTFVMVGHVRAFRDMIAQAIPDLLQAVQRAELWAGAETYIAESVYSQVPASDFSRRVLSVKEARLLVLRVHDLGWSDLGHPGRVMAVLEESGYRPRWWTPELRKGMATAGSLPARSAVA